MMFFRGTDVDHEPKRKKKRETSGSMTSRYLNKDNDDLVEDEKEDGNDSMTSRYLNKD